MYVFDINTSFGRRTEFDYDLSLGNLLSPSTATSRPGTHLLAPGRALPGPRRQRRDAGRAGRHPHLLPVGTLDLRDALGWEPELDRCLTSGVRAFAFFPEFQAGRFLAIFRAVLKRLAGSGPR